MTPAAAQLFRQQAYIDGQWCDAQDASTQDIFNPANGALIGRAPNLGSADAQRAIAAADKAWPAWRAKTAKERAAILGRWHQLMLANADDLAAIMTAEQGKPLAQSKIETLAGADIIDSFAEEARRTYGQVIPARAPGVTQLTVKEAVGPVAAFTPWNFPINQVVRKVSLALAAGCTIIVKGPEETPGSPAELIRAFADAGIPAGAVNLVYGDPAEISGYLIPHSIIKKISFTGSTAVGKKLAALAGAHMKRSTMELGGHAPVLVFDDADVEQAAGALVGSKFRNAGQVCISPTRFLVQEGVADGFTNRFVAAAEAIKVGPGNDADSEMGPLANERRIPALERMIRDAVDRGANLRTGGRRIGNEGWFFEPTVLTDVPVDAEIMNEEPFGPVAVINRFADDDAAIEEANRLAFGLAAYAWTSSSARATRLQNEVQAGMLTVNHIGLSLPEVPFGGIGDSGIGNEGGSEAIEAYLQTRFVTRLG